MKSETYFETLSAALNRAILNAIDKGFLTDEDQLFRELGTGGVGYEETKSVSIELTKDGKPSRKCLHISIYRMASGRYELNDYIN